MQPYMYTWTCICTYSRIPINNKPAPALLGMLDLKPNSHVKVKRPRVGRKTNGEANEMMIEDKQREERWEQRQKKRIKIKWNEIK